MKDNIFLASCSGVKSQPLPPRHGDSWETLWLGLDSTGQFGVGERGSGKKKFPQLGTLLIAAVNAAISRKTK